VIKTAIKHHIIDFCISILFDNIFKNVGYSSPRKNKLPLTGEMFSKIIHTKDDKKVTYYNCRIMYSIDGMARFSVEHYSITTGNSLYYTIEDINDFLIFRYITIKDLKYLEFYQ
jgi:hypothetical protein